ncbi:hypothetical protein GVN24_23405 [Rhizobium sp. CRIBSB]|nr:hypothetical protein [Rhizobium sp. CRIBSB]
MTLQQKIYDISGAITAFAAVAALGVTGGYYSASSENAALKRDLDLLTSAQGSIKTIETLKELSETSDNLFKFEQHAAEISNLQGKINSLEASLSAEKNLNSIANQQLTKKNDELSKLMIDRDKLKADIKMLTSEYEIFQLKVNQSRTSLPGGQAIGLNSVFTSFVTVSTPGGTENISVGQKTAWHTEYSTCTLTLTEIESKEETVKFMIDCK